MVTPWCKEGNLKFLSNFGASNDTGVSSDECPLVLTLRLNVYILASYFFETDDKYVFKARNSCCV